MNRADRRKLPPAIRAIANNLDNVRCPDCDNDARLRQDSDGIWHLDIQHDDTCPWFKRHQQRKATS